MLLAFLRRLTHRTPARRPARHFEPIGHLVDARETPAGVEFQMRIINAEAFAAAVAGSPLEAWHLDLDADGRLVPFDRSAENRRAAIATELLVATPRPDLERVVALAEFAQTYREGSDDAEFAWASYSAAGGAMMSPWRAFRAGLDAAAARLRS